MRHDPRATGGCSPKTSRPVATLASRPLSGTEADAVRDLLETMKSSP